MPTGYTAPVQSGEITAFPDFAMNMARGYGATIAMRDMSRDAPMTDENLSFDTGYHERGIEEAAARLREVASWTPEEADEAARRHNQERLKQYLLGVRENRATRQRYGAMLVQAEAWIPPTAEHIEFKNGMVEQLERAMEWDCNDGERPEKIDGATLREQEIDRAVRDIAYHNEHKAEANVANEQRISWVRTLETSLVEFEPVDTPEAPAD